MPPQNISPIEQTFEPILNAYRWHIQSLHIDEHAIRIEYDIKPPLSPTPRGNNKAALIGLWGSATDNLGNDYSSVGGAYGLSTDKQSTTGVLSFNPFPAIGATTLTSQLEIVAGEKEQDSITFPAPLSPSTTTQKANTKQ